MSGATLGVKLTPTIVALCMTLVCMGSEAPAQAAAAAQPTADVDPDDK